MRNTELGVRPRLALALSLLGALAIAPVTASAQTAATYGLKAGKPYDGTKLKFLICCGTAGQFAQLTALTGEGSEFQKLTGITATWENTPYESFQQKTVIEATTGSTYDLVAWVDSWGEALKPYMVPLNDRIKADKINLADYPQAYIDAATDDKGNITGLPLRGHPLVLFYRKDVFDKLKLPVPKTWQDVIKTSKVIQEKTDLTGISLMYKVNAGQNMFNWVSMLWGNGGDILDKSGKAVFNSTKGLQATQTYIDMIRKDKITNPAATTFAEPESSAEILQGRAAMWVGWWWYFARFADPKAATAEVVGNIGFTPAPGWAGSKSAASYALIWPIGIFKTSKNQDAAWEFIKYVTNTNTQQKTASNRTDLSKADNTIVTFSGMNNAKVNAANNGIPKVGAAVLKTARTLPQVKTWAEIQSVIEIGINKMATGADVKSTMDQMAADVNAIQKRAGLLK